jgi:hypothetical protein
MGKIQCIAKKVLEKVEVVAAHLCGGRGGARGYQA